MKRRQAVIDEFRPSRSSTRAGNEPSDDSAEEVAPRPIRKWSQNAPEQRKINSVIGYWLAATGLPGSIMDLPDTHLMFDAIQPKLTLQVGTEYSNTELLKVYENMKSEIRDLITDASLTVQGNLTVELQTSSSGRKFLVLKMQLADEHFVYRNITLDVVELTSVPTVHDISRAFDSILEEYHECWDPKCRMIVTYRTHNEVPDAVVTNKMVAKTWYDGVSRIERAFNNGCQRVRTISELANKLQALNKVLNGDDVVRNNLAEVCTMNAGKNYTLVI